MVILAIVFVNSACESTELIASTDEALSAQSEVNLTALAALELRQQAAQIALPFCEQQHCIDIQIQSIATQDAWINRWIAQRQAMAIQDRIGLKQKMSLQQAVDAFVQYADHHHVQQEGLNMSTRIAYQRQKFLLLKLSIAVPAQAFAEQQEIAYFAVLDRQAKKQLSLMEIIQPEQYVLMDTLVQQAYQDWLRQQSKQVQHVAAKKLYWGQADWWFDQEGIGLHFRPNQIVAQGGSLAITLNHLQSRQLLKAAIYAQMF